MSNLIFLRTVSVDMFKKEHGVKKLDIMRSDTSGKQFFVFGNDSGAVSSNFDPATSANPVVSKVKSEDSDEEPFYLLHNKGEVQASLVASL